MDFEVKLEKKYIYINHTETETGILKSWKSHKRKRSQTAGQYLKRENKKNSCLSKFHLRIAICSSTNTQKHHSTIVGQTIILVVLTSIFITLYKKDDDKSMNESIFTEKYLSCQYEFHQEMFSLPLAFHHKTEADVESLCFLEFWKYSLGKSSKSLKPKQIPYLSFLLFLCTTTYISFYLFTASKT